MTMHGIPPMDAAVDNAPEFSDWCEAYEALLSAPDIDAFWTAIDYLEENAPTDIREGIHLGLEMIVNALSNRLN